MRLRYTQGLIRFMNCVGLSRMTEKITFDLINTVIKLHKLFGFRKSNMLNRWKSMIRYLKQELKRIFKLYGVLYECIC